MLLAAREALVGARTADGAWTLEGVASGTPDEAIAVAGPMGRRARAIVGRAPELDDAGLAALLRVDGPSAPRLLYARALRAPDHPSALAVVVEEQPAGTSLSGWWSDAPVGERGLAALAWEVAGWHAAGAVVDGLHPELVFVERPAAAGDEPRITALAPRAIRLWDACPPADRYVARCLDDLYSFRPAPDPAERGAPEDDVFALAAIAWHRLAGVHPFGDDRTSQLLAIAGGGSPRANGAAIRPEVREVLLAALDARPGVRPTAAELAAALSPAS